MIKTQDIIARFSISSYKVSASAWVNAINDCQCHLRVLKGCCTSHGGGGGEGGVNYKTNWEGHSKWKVEVRPVLWHNSHMTDPKLHTRKFVVKHFIVTH